jgi:predicted ATPase
MFVSRLKLQNWKNFKDTKADLSRRMFIIGPNAAGKSNLLDAFRFLRDLSDKGLEKAVDARGGVSPIRCLAARQSPSIMLDVELSEANGTPRWRYRITFNQDAQRTPQVREERVTDLRSGKDLVERPDADDEQDPVRLTQTALEQIIANRDFRPVADFFRSISYQHIIPQVVRDPQGFSPGPVQDDPFGRDFLQRLWNTNQRTREAWLRRISIVLQKAVPQLRSLEVEMDQQGTPHLVGRYEHWRPHDARQDESQFSDGTLRLFGLMWAMFEGDGPLLLEEPELSLHTEVVRSLPQLLAQLQSEIRKMRRRSKTDYDARQLLISTHSEEMLRDEGIGAHEVLRIEPSPEGSVIEHPDEADREALKAGLTVADVILPKSRPKNGQLVFNF